MTRAHPPIYIFLLCFIGLLWSQNCAALSLPHIYGAHPSPHFIQSYHQRLLLWMKTQWPQPFTQLNKEEQIFIQEWAQNVSNWGYSLSEEQIFETMSFTVGLADGQLIAPSLFIALTSWPKPLQQKLYSIIQKRARTLTSSERDSVYGIGWNLQTGTFEIHFLHSSHKELVGTPQLHKRAQSYSSLLWHPHLKHIEVFSKNKKKILDGLWLAIHKNHHILYPKKIPLDIRTAQLFVPLYETEEWRLYVRSFYLPLIDPQTHPVIQALRSEFQLSPTSITFTDPQNFKIYYP